MFAQRNFRATNPVSRSTRTVPRTTKSRHQDHQIPSPGTTKPASRTTKSRIQEPPNTSPGTPGKKGTIFDQRPKLLFVLDLWQILEIPRRYHASKTTGGHLRFSSTFTDSISSRQRAEDLCWTQSLEFPATGGQTKDIQVHAFFDAPMRLQGYLS